MSKLILVLIFLTTAQALPTHLIPIGPWPVEPGSAAYTVSIVFNDIPTREIYHICGGSIISSQWIVTAGHCAISPAFFRYSVQAGIHDLSHPESTAQTIPVSQIIVHEQYDVLTLQNDIALFKLATPLVLGSEVRAQAVALPNPGFLAEGTATVTGYQPGGQSPSPYLSYVDLNIKTDEECREVYGQADYDIADSMICAANDGQVNFCQGASGGPMVVNRTTNPVLVGIISWGLGCAQPQFYDVHTEVSYFRDWIREKTGV